MDKRAIAKLFSTHDVPVAEADIWAVQGTPVIKHSALERLSAALKITWDVPVIIRAERDECVLLARASRQDGISEWSLGEATLVLMKDSGRKNSSGKPIYEAPEGVSGNYQVTPKQASYVYAMAEKRAKDRVIIKLAGLHGAYSEEEADDFKSSRADRPEDGRQDEERVSPAMEYAAKAKIRIQTCADAKSLLSWWEGEAEARKKAGLTREDPIGVDLGRAFVARKSELSKVREAA